jgi:hypothetical protein
MPNIKLIACGDYVGSLPFAPVARCLLSPLIATRRYWEAH